MKRRVRLLNFSAGATIILLTIAGILIVLGIFNESLNWDIFGPKVEAVLYGIFGSSIALACVGVAMTIVLGTQEIVTAFRAIQHQRIAKEKMMQQEAPKRVYALYMLSVTLLLAVFITSLAFANYGVQKHRSKVFKRLVAEQMIHFQPKLSQLLSPLSVPPRDNVSFDLYDLVSTLDNLSFVNKTTIYLPDPDEKSAMWKYTACSEYNKENGFARLFVAKAFEEAIAKGIEGNAKKLDKLNERTGFTWYYLVKNEKNKMIAVIRINGNSRENFREYIFGS